MAGRHHHSSSGSLFLTLLVAGFVLLLLPTRYTSKINFVFVKAFGPVLSLGGDIPGNSLTGPADNNTTESLEYKRLLKSYTQLRAQTEKLLENYERVARIRSALPECYSGLVPAEVSGTFGPLSHEIIINQGASSGIKTGHYVLSEERNSIIGVVRETSQRLAKVRLLTDAKQGIEVLIQRENRTDSIRAMMFGDGKNQCTIPKVDREQDIQVGDWIYAASFPGRLDVSVIIGTVTEVHPDEKYPLLWDITVTPVEDLFQLDRVAVIVPDTGFEEGEG